MVSLTAEMQKCPDPDTLAYYFSEYGFSLLLSSHIDSISKHFDLFAPIIVESQRPGYKLSFKLQKFYRNHANSNQKHQMLIALREWLAADYDNISFKGSYVIWPLSDVQHSNNVLRIKAAEMLVDWKDIEALPLIQSIEDYSDNDKELLWHLKRTELRMTDPCAMTFLYRRTNNSLGCCKKYEDITEATVQHAMDKSNPTRYYLTDEELQNFFILLAYSELCDNTRWTGGWHTIMIVFDDGVQASLCPSPTDPGEIVYKDNTSIERHRRLTFMNDRLHTWMWSIFDRELGDE